MIVLVAQGCRRRGDGEEQVPGGFMLAPPSCSSGLTLDLGLP